MGNDDVPASLAHVVLICMAGNGAGRLNPKSLQVPGMHTNLFLHGIIGACHFSSALLDNDFTEIYKYSVMASRYLPLPCLNADVYNNDTTLSMVHFVSGAIPFVLAISGNENKHLGNLCIAANLISLCYNAYSTDRRWGFYCAGAAFLSYFASSLAEQPALYPLGLALMEFCAFKLFHVPVVEPRGRRGAGGGGGGRSPR